MILDPLSPASSLSAARGLVEALREGLAGDTCPQWTGVGADAYRASQGEVVACAQGLIDDIQQALDLVPALDAERAQALAREVASRAGSGGACAAGPTAGAW